MSPILTDGLRSVGRAWPAGEKRQFEQKCKAESDVGPNPAAARPLTVNRRARDRVSRQGPGARAKQTRAQAMTKRAADQAAGDGAPHRALSAGARPLAATLMMVVVVIIPRRRRLSLGAPRQSGDQRARRRPRQKPTHHRSPKH